jgi:hypothetical protein
MERDLGYVGTRLQLRENRTGGIGPSLERKDYNCNCAQVIDYSECR